MKLKNILFFSTALLAIPVSTTLSSCSEHYYNTNYITSGFYNSYDMLTALGVTPETQAKTSKILEIDYYPYMENFINAKNTKFEYFGESSSQPNLKQLKKFKTNTLVLNEWARVEQPVYLKTKGITKNIAYTSMADTENARYEKFETNSTYNWFNYDNFQPHSYRNSLMMLAKDLDKYYWYDNKTLQNNLVEYKTYEDRARDIIKKDNELIKYLKSEIDKIDEFKITNKKTGQVEYKTIGIFAAQDGQGSIAESDQLKAIYDPFIYPMIYGPSATNGTNQENTNKTIKPNKDGIINDGIGLGFKFPTPASSKNLSWAGNKSLAGIIAENSNILKEEFKQKFDYIIYVATPDIKNKDISKRQELKIDEIKKTIKEKHNLEEFLKPNKNVNNTNDIDPRIEIVNYVDWYPTTWGTIGSRHVLNEFIKVLNKFLNKTNNQSQKIKTLDEISNDNTINSSIWWNAYNPEELVKPNKK